MDNLFGNYGGIPMYSQPQSLGGMAQWGAPNTSVSAYGPGLLDGGVRDMRFPGGSTNTIATPAALGESSWLDSIGGLDGAKLGLGAVGGVANAFMAMQQYGLAKKTLNENKRQFELNYGAQRDTTNTAMRDRQAARVASNSGAYQSVDDYMATNGIR